MSITELQRERILLSTLREGARLLTIIIESLDVTPAPDGAAVRFAFQGDGALLDRLSVWGVAFEDMEDVKENDEDDARDLPKAKPEECVRDIRESLREVLADFRAEAGDLPALVPVPLPVVPLAA